MTTVSVNQTSHAPRWWRTLIKREPPPDILHPQLIAMGFDPDISREALREARTTPGVGHACVLAWATDLAIHSTHTLGPHGTVEAAASECNMCALLSMGFPRPLVVRALAPSKGDIRAATGRVVHYSHLEDDVAYQEGCMLCDIAKGKADARAAREAEAAEMREELAQRRRGAQALRSQRRHGGGYSHNHFANDMAMSSHTMAHNAAMNAHTTAHNNAMAASGGGGGGHHGGCP